MINNPVGDLFARVRNAVLAGKQELTVPYSRLRLDVCRVLEQEGYLKTVKKAGNLILIEPAYKKRKPVLTHIRGISRPGLRVFKKTSKIPRVLGGAGTVIVSTSKGVMSGEEAKKKNLGGEVFGEVW